MPTLLTRFYDSVTRPGANHGIGRLDGTGSGQPVSDAFTAHTRRTDQPGGVESDPLELWWSATDAIRRWLDAGDAKVTYATGNFLVQNPGREPVEELEGLLTTVLSRP